MIAQPSATYRDLGALFEVTPQFICMLVNTDMFQALMRKKLDALGEGISLTVRDKLVGLLDLTVENLTEKVVTGTASERLLGDTFGKTLAALGYAPSGAGVASGGQTNIQVVVGGADLVAARERAAEAFAGKAELKNETVSSMDGQNG